MKLGGLMVGPRGSSYIFSSARSGAEHHTAARIAQRQRRIATVGHAIVDPQRIVTRQVICPGRTSL
jgi:hypothetical protein